MNGLISAVNKQKFKMLFTVLTLQKSETNAKPIKTNKTNQGSSEPAYSRGEADILLCYATLGLLVRHLCFSLTSLCFPPLCSLAVRVVRWGSYLIINT